MRKPKFRNESRKPPSPSPWDPATKTQIPRSQLRGDTGEEAPTAKATPKVFQPQRRRLEDARHRRPETQVQEQGGHPGPGGKAPVAPFLPSVQHTGPRQMATAVTPGREGPAPQKTQVWLGVELADSSCGGLRPSGSGTGHGSQGLEAPSPVRRTYPAVVCLSPH